MDQPFTSARQQAATMKRSIRLRRDESDGVVGRSISAGGTWKSEKFPDVTQLAALYIFACTLPKRTPPNVQLTQIQIALRLAHQPIDLRRDVEPRGLVGEVRAGELHLDAP